MIFNNCTNLKKSFSQYLTSKNSNTIIENIYRQNRQQSPDATAQIVLRVAVAAIEDYKESQHLHQRNLLHSLAEASLFRIQVEANLNPSISSKTKATLESVQMLCSIFPSPFNSDDDEPEEVTDIENEEDSEDENSLIPPPLNAYLKDEPDSLSPTELLDDTKITEMLQEHPESLCLPKTVCFLLENQKHQFVTAILNLIRSNTVIAPWWDDPQEKTRVFCEAIANNYPLNELVTEINPNFIDKRGKSLLVYAAEKKLEELSKILLSKGARIRTAKTQLIESFTENFFDSVIQESKATIEQSPLVLIQYLDLDRKDQALALFEELLKRPKEKQPLWLKDAHAKAKLFDAACDAKVSPSFLLLILQQGIEPNYKNPENKSVLQKAIPFQSAEVVSILLNQGAKLGAGASKSAYKDIINFIGPDFIRDFLKSWDIKRKESVDLICQLYYANTTTSKQQARSLLQRATKNKSPWMNDTFYRTKLLTYALFATDSEQIELLFKAGKVDANYTIEETNESIVYLAAHYAHSINHMQHLASRVFAEQITFSLIHNGADLHTLCDDMSIFVCISNILGSPFARRCIDKIDVSFPNTLDLICHLFDIEENSLARSLLERVENSPTAAWWNNPKAKAQLFCNVASKGLLSTAYDLVDEIDIDFEDEQGNTPLAYVLAYQDTDLIERLVARGASISAIFDGDMKTCTACITTDFDKTYLEKILALVPLEHENSFRLLCNLLKSKQLFFAQSLFERIYSLPEEEQPTWWKNPRKMALLFFDLVAAFDATSSVLYRIEHTYEKYEHNLHVIAGRCDYTARCEQGKTPLMHAALYQRQDLVTFFIQQGASLHDKMTNPSSESFSAFHLIQQQFSPEVGLTIIKSLSLEINHAGHLLPVLIEEGSYEDALVLFNRLQNEQPISSSWNAKTKTHTFITLATSQMPNESKNKLLQTLHTTMNLFERDPVTGRTALMAASANKTNPSYITSLLQQGGMQILLQQDRSGISNLQYLLINKTAPLSSPIWKTLLKGLGLSDTTISQKTSHELQLAYIQNEFFSSKAPLVQRIAIAALFANTKKIQELFASLSLNASLSYIDALYCIYPHLVDEVVNAVFSVNKAHFAQVTGSTTIPAHDQTVSINDLISLYEKYSASTDDTGQKMLELLVTRVTNKIEFTGTPQANSAALTELYSRIDNATCHVLSYFKKAIAKLEAEHKKELLTLSKEGHKKACALLDLLRCYFKELIDAANNCGPRLHTHTMEQYHLIINNKKRTAQEALSNALATGRLFLIEELIGNDENNVHAYNEFLALYGKEFGIPVHTLLTTYTDPYAISYKEEAEEARDQFTARYSPQFLLDTAAHEFEESSSKALLDKHLIAQFSKVLASQDAQTIKHILPILFFDQTTTKQNKVELFLNAHAFTINNMTSLAATLKEIDEDYEKNEPQTLYNGMRISVEEKGVKYMPGTLLRLLVEGKIIAKFIQS